MTEKDQKARHKEIASALSQISEQELKKRAKEIEKELDRAIADQLEARVLGSS
uniref:Uncharacterized protein n=1 Tax=Candidatus Kentrum sp. SD TaxID=2126332 RepID=A0A450YRF5_9GAMM|nr:MAG: hypothetical protein BECKSD772F_GA0070984_11685 [Candidatus Kentron sp. SD]VFK44479.1 MAG: hypothetical protein BECKSD772E_GA0070983_103823 [Candidatus Kentron sp. SD]